MSKRTRPNSYENGYADAVFVVDYNEDHKQAALAMLSDTSVRITNYLLEAYHGMSPRVRRRARREFKRLFAWRLGFLAGYFDATGVDLALERH